MKTRILTTLSIGMIAAGVTGCGTITEGTSQSIAVSSSPSGAYCGMTRKGEKLAVVERTPGQVTVRKTKDDIELNCTLAGYAPASQYLHSGVAAGTFGNIILGGVVGWGIDSATGADNKYPETVNVTFAPLQPAPAQASAPAPAPETPAPAADAEAKKPDSSPTS